MVENNEEFVPGGGDDIDIGSIEGEGIAIGRNARVEINRYAEYIVRVDTLEELPPKPGEPPYKGLAYFTEADADIFFGRKELSDDLAARIETTRFLAVVGASGSGKSSLLRAGVVPRLRQQNWRIHIISPTADPLGQLANNLTSDEAALDAADKMRAQLLAEPQTLRRAAEKAAARSSAARFLLIVDQFEELFTQKSEEEERRAFVDNLLPPAASAGGIHILIGLRADFTGHLAEPEELRALVQEHFVLLGPMRQEDLVRVIMEPARVGGWAFVDGLVEQILKDVGREPGRLPLLSHALLETWKRRAAHVMTLKGYQEAGGVDGAIAKTAEDTLRQLGDSEKQAIMQAIFLELTELGEGAEDTRRITQRAALARIGDEADVNTVLEALVTARLVTVDGDSVEVAHEALIRRWPQLREWLEDNRERLRFERQLERDAQGWEDLDRDRSELYGGVRLAQALEWQKHDQNLSRLAGEFLTASQVEAKEEAKQAKQLERAGFVRRVAYVIGGLAVLALIAAIAAGFFGYQSYDTAGELSIETTRAVSAEAEAVAAKSTSEFNEELARQEEDRALEAEAFAVDAQATSEVNEVLAREEESKAREAETTAIAAEAEAVAAQNEVERLNRETRALRLAAEADLALERDPEQALLLAVVAHQATAPESDSAGGFTVVVHQATASEGENVGVFTTGEARAALYHALDSPYRTTLEGHTNRVSSAVFSPDGERILTASLDNTARLWDSEGQPLEVLEGHASSVFSAVFSADGERILTSNGGIFGSGDKTARLWDKEGGLWQCWKGIRLRSGRRSSARTGSAS